MIKHNRKFYLFVNTTLSCIYTLFRTDFHWKCYCKCDMIFIHFESRWTKNLWKDRDTIRSWGRWSITGKQEQGWDWVKLLWCKADDRHVLRESSMDFIIIKIKKFNGNNLHCTVAWTNYYHYRLPQKTIAHKLGGFPIVKGN